MKDFTPLKSTGDHPALGGQIRARTASMSRVRTTSNNMEDYLSMPMLGHKQKPLLNIVGDVVGKTCIIVEGKNRKF